MEFTEIQASNLLRCPQMDGARCEVSCCLEWKWSGNSSFDGDKTGSCGLDLDEFSQDTLIDIRRNNGHGKPPTG